MKERPILFSGPMVKVILEGHKTQTRRVITPQPEVWNEGRLHGSPLLFAWKDKVNTPANIAPGCMARFCPYGRIGDRLWVRETWASDDNRTAWYRADGETYNAGLPWRPSIHMPRWASRIILEIVSVRVERVQDISNKDALAEGIATRYHPDAPHILTYCDYSRTDRYAYGEHFGPRESFRSLWNSINEKRGYGWAVNPWVWVVEFKRVEPTSGAHADAPAAGVRNV